MKDETYNQITNGDRSVEITLNAGDLFDVVNHIVDKAYERIQELMAQLEEPATITQKEAAKFLRKSIRQLQRYEEEGSLVPYRVGRTPLYKESQLRKFLGEQYPDLTPPAL